MPHVMPIIVGLAAVLCCSRAPAAEPEPRRQRVAPPSAAERQRIQHEVEAGELGSILALRQPLRFGAFLSAVLVPESHLSVLKLSGWMPELAVGVRWAFDTSVGIQARTGFASSSLAALTGYVPYSTKDADAQNAACRAIGADSTSPLNRGLQTTQADAFIWSLDATLRWHHAGNRVPAFIGIGPWLVLAHTSGAATAQILCAVDGFWELAVPTPYRVERTATTLLWGFVLEFGTYLASDDQFELGLRVGYASAATDELASHTTLALYFGVMLP